MPSDCCSFSSFVSECQNYGSLNREPEELRMATAIIVIAVSALDGSVSRGLPVPEWQHHAHLTKGVVPITPVGYMVDTPQ